MHIAKYSTLAEKKDLHVGGLGVATSGALAAVVDPWTDAVMGASDTWLRKVKYAARSADDYVRTSPWQAVGLVALMGLTAGYLLSRRS
jgi:ElaB/YqjD/DUF883 family membrane-anchored ribosome-binding protein